MRAGKYNDDVEILLGFNEEEGHMVTSIFEAFPLLYSAMAAGWPILGESEDFAKPLFLMTHFLHHVGKPCFSFRTIHTSQQASH